MKRKRKCMGFFMLLIVFMLAVPVKAASSARPRVPVLKAIAYQNEVTLTWDPVKNAGGYQLYLYYKVDNGFRCIANIKAGEERKVVLKGSLDRIYRYKIRAYNKTGGKTVYSRMSEELQVKTAPSKVQITLAEKRSRSMTLVKWKKTASADGYQVFRSERENGGYKRIGVNPGNETFSFQDTNTEGKKWFYRVRAYRRNKGSVVYGAYSIPLVTQERPLMVIGDSRTVMLQNLIEDDTAWICKIGMGYQWLAETAVTEAEKALKKNSDIVIWLGVNDPCNISNYIVWLNEQIPVWRRNGARVYIMAVGQVEDDPYVDNEEIREFNTRMRKEIKGAKYIDLYTYLERAGYDTIDGTHYDNATSMKVYQYMRNYIR